MDCCCDAMVSKGASRTRGIEFEFVDRNDLQYHPIALTMEPGVVERPVVLHAKKPLLLVCYNRE